VCVCVRAYMRFARACVFVCACVRVFVRARVRVCVNIMAARVVVCILIIFAPIKL